MQEIVIHVKDRENPVRFLVAEVMEENTLTQENPYLTFKDEEGREGRLIFNPANIAVVAIFPR
jgi:hypothetical protein